MILNAVYRLRADSAVKHNDHWIEDVEKEQETKPKELPLPEDLYTESPSTIAYTLRSRCKDFQEALSKLSFYRNRQGDNLDDVVKNKLDQAKALLYRFYDKGEPPEDNTE